MQAHHEAVMVSLASSPGVRADPEELRAHCAERPSPHKVPRDIRLVRALSVY